MAPGLCSTDPEPLLKDYWVGRTWQLRNIVKDLDLLRV